ncbi:MAG: trans-2-enoyl-CoA reductase family protein [Gemmatimonadota bacterium]|nr:trans-2-enoyl-CoA reductase family protein [Gemmatimonadota bacterium]MDH5803893.1 trans-2-enoyl-CoA reductase family protein [Gemmatimonadota bacterium]
MIIKPKIRGYFCLTAHPEGCAANVRDQISYITHKGPIRNGPRRVLVIGGSTGYGLSSRIAAAFGCHADTLSVCFEKPATEKRPATAGWYNTVAFEKAAREAGFYAETVNGDAFSDEIKEETVRKIQEKMGQVDLIVYSLASPRRTHPITGTTSHSVLKPVGAPYSGKTLHTDTNQVRPVDIEPASQQEIEDTITVMGGEDWEMWLAALTNADALAPGCRTVAYTYIGSDATRPVYRAGTIGKAKEDLERAAKAIDSKLQAIGGTAHVAAMKAVVTQSSSAIPVVPLYISLLFKIMKEKEIHEGCVEQVQRLFETRLYSEGEVETDDHNIIRLDDWEMREDVQTELTDMWKRVNTENLNELADYRGYIDEFLLLFGFGRDDIDYDEDIEHEINMGA